MALIHRRKRSRLKMSKENIAKLRAGITENIRIPIDTNEIRKYLDDAGFSGYTFELPYPYQLKLVKDDEERRWLCKWERDPLGWSHVLKLSFPVDTPDELFNLYWDSYEYHPAAHVVFPAQRPDVVSANLFYSIVHKSMRIVEIDNSLFWEFDICDLYEK